MSKKHFTFTSNMEIQRLSKNKAHDIKSLFLKRERDRTGLFLAEGEKCVRDLWEYFEIKYLVVTPNWIESHEYDFNRFRKKILVSDKRGIEIISSMSSLPEVIGVFEKPTVDPFPPTLIANKLYLLLDEIQDPGNMGTIIRTCDWFGVYNVFASMNTVDVYGPKVVQASMGSLSRVKVRYCNLEELIDDNMNLPVIGTLLSGKDINKTEITGGALLLMGNEGRGISENLKRKITTPVTIPPFNLHQHPDSLNVAIATSIILNCLRAKF